MAGYLIAEEGPLVGLCVRFEAGTEWSLGRDPELVDQVLEDSDVSQEHAICRLTPEGYVLENLSTTNPVIQNGKIITEPVLLHEGDILKIGNTFFRFTYKDPNAPKEEEIPSSAFEDKGELDFSLTPTSRWILKVISGPNSGAEFPMESGKSYIIGKDPNVSDIVFQDLTVSKKHARLSLDENFVPYIEDLGSRNGVSVNGELIIEPKRLESQDLVALGTTSFIVIDREKPLETIIPAPKIIPEPTPQPPVIEEEIKKEIPTPIEAPIPPKKMDWRSLVIPKKHLIIAGSLLLSVLVFVFAILSLLKTEEIEVVKAAKVNEEIKDVVKKYESIEFSFNEGTGTLFLVGHVLTSVNKLELIYELKNIPYIQNIDDNVVIDEYVWQNMNSLIITNPNWAGINFRSIKPGHFIVTGYLKTVEEAQKLADYVNLNFPYLDKLENQVVIETNLIQQIQGILMSQGFSSINFQVSNGDLVLTGRADKEHLSQFNKMLKTLKEIPGIRNLKNFVVETTAESARIDLTSKYQVTGVSMTKNKISHVLINNKIVAENGIFDGMRVTKISSNTVFLEKDGLKFKIDYNQ